jgi:signal transduction histidine kinase/ActR/RegA family two-component response regulator
MHSPSTGTVLPGATDVAAASVLLADSGPGRGEIATHLTQLGIAPAELSPDGAPDLSQPPLAAIVCMDADPRATLERIRRLHALSGWRNVVVVLALERGAPVPHAVRVYDAGPLDVLPLPASRHHIEVRLRLYQALTVLPGVSVPGGIRDLGLALQQAPEGVALVDDRGRMVFSNPAFEALTGAVAGDLSHLRAVGFPDVPLWSVLDEVGSAWEGDLRARTDGGIPDGRELAGTLTRLDGELSGDRILLVVRDVSRIRLLERQVADSQRLEAIGQLAGGVAHDFNNVLSVITTLSELLMRLKSRDDPDREDLEEIYQSAVRGSELTRQLLAFSRAETGDAQRIDLNELLKGNEKMLRRLLPEDLALTMELAPRLPSIWGDPVHLDQMILNLAVNARDAMPRGGSVTFRTWSEHRSTPFQAGDAHLGAGDYVVFEISDDGPGLPDEIRSRIFEPFFTTQGRARASGLGLSVVRGRVQATGGGIQVESIEGEGTTFRIFLPTAETGGGYGGDEAWPRGDELVLLVEDQANLRKGLRRFLTELGYDVMDAADGAEAWSLMQAGVLAPSLVLSDVVMPEMSGLDLAEALGGIGFDAPVLLMSGYADHPEVARATRDGLKILPKPVDLGHLAREIRTALDRQTPTGTGAPAPVPAPTGGSR